MSSQMVRFDRVSKCYGRSRYALKDINFALRRGEFAYVTGVSGAGKTTLLRLLFAMEVTSQGFLYVNNREVSTIPRNKIPEFRREVGFVFQDFKLLPDLNVYDNVALPLEIRKMKIEDIEYRAMGVLSLVGLSDRANDYPLSLSGGEQQRIAIARSIIGKPNLLLADEPTGNLDNQTAREIISLFQEIHNLGTTVLIATHDETLIQNFPARVITLEDGAMLSDRSLEV